MSDDQASEAQEGSVFEGLPRKRPSLRTPGREKARAEHAAQEDDASQEERPAGEPHSGGIEGLALAGIGAAAEIASLGRKIAGGALGGLRGAVGRR